MAATSIRKGLKATADGTNITDVTISLDIDMRHGTPIDETGWLDGFSSDGYPGNLSGFLASNSDGQAAGSLRMVTIRAEAGTTTAGTVTFSSVSSSDDTDSLDSDDADGTPVTKIVAVIGTNLRAAHHMSVSINGSNALQLDITGANAAADADITVLLI